MAGGALPFEGKLAELEAQLERVRRGTEELGVRARDDVAELERRLEAERRRVYAGLGAWERLLAARHPGRPGGREYAAAMVKGYEELRGGGGGLGWVNGRRTAVLAPGRAGWAGTEWWVETAAKVLELAGKFGLPVVVFLEGGAEGGELRRGCGAVLKALLRLESPVVAAVVGEAWGEGAGALAAANRILMQENAFFGAMRAEECAQRFWGSRDRAPEAAEALKGGAKDALALHVADEIVEEPAGGAQTDPEGAARRLRDVVERTLEELAGYGGAELRRMRAERLRGMGLFAEGGGGR